MIGSFKFMQSRYKEQFLGGRIRFGSLNYYRRLEILGGNSAIGDSAEGRMLNEINAQLEDHDASHDDLDRYRVAGLHLAQTPHHSTIRMSMHNYADCHIFCFSHGIMRRLIERFGRHNESFSCCIEILSPAKLVDAVLNTGRFIDSDALDGTKLLDLGVEIRHRQVRYEEAIRLIPRQMPSAGDPAIKRPRYWYQREHRFVLTLPRHRLIQDTLTIEYKVPPNVFKVIYESSAEPEITDRPTELDPTPSEKLDDLRAVLSEIDAVSQGSRITPKGDWSRDLRCKLDKAYAAFRHVGPACPGVDARFQFYSEPDDLCQLAWFVRRYVDAVERAGINARHVELASISDFESRDRLAG